MRAVPGKVDERGGGGGRRGKDEGAKEQTKKVGSPWSWSAWEKEDHAL